jgi:hypothetical protein
MIAAFETAGKTDRFLAGARAQQISQSGHNASLVAPDCRDSDFSIASSGWRQG